MNCLSMPGNSWGWEVFISSIVVNIHMVVEYHGDHKFLITLISPCIAICTSLDKFIISHGVFVFSLFEVTSQKTTCRKMCFF